MKRTDYVSTRDSEDKVQRYISARDIEDEGSKRDLTRYSGIFEQG